MFKQNTTISITYRDPDTFTLRGEMRIRWSNKANAYIVSLWKYRGRSVAMSCFTSWEGVKSYIERVEDLSKKNNAFLAMAKRLLDDYSHELKEFEYERIRGAIVDHLKDNNLTEWAAWLEKQGTLGKS